MGNKRCYYEILGVSRTAETVELKASYRKLALKYHPDRNPGDNQAEEKFKEASEAYDVLRDTQKRKIYDQYGHQGLEGSGFSGFGGFEDIFSSFGDIFEDFFGFSTNRRSRSNAQKGSDLRYDMTLTFMQAAFGVEQDIEVKKNDTCHECNGNGCASGTQPETCSYCHGSGQLSRSQGFFTVRSTCQYCRGKGKVIATPCSTCRGRGQIIVKKKVMVKIPAGVDSGSRLRLLGEGESGKNGGPTGDLYVFIDVDPHEFFVREENDIISDVEISMIKAALGGKHTVETLEDQRTIKIPKGTQHGDILRLHGLGIPSLRNNKRGDQIIRFILKTPTNINKKQEDLLKEFNKIEEKKLTNKLKNILRNSFANASA